MNIPFSFSFSAKTNAPEFAAALAQFIRFHGYSVSEGLRKEGGRTGMRLISFTPPRTKKQGEEAVERDIDRLFTGLSRTSEAKWQSLGGDQVVRLFSTKAGIVYGVDRALFRPSAGRSEMHVHHQKHRGKRGKVTRAGSYTRDVGRWRFLDRMAVSEEALKEYIATVKARVGRAKGGWAAATKALGGRVTNWVMRHKDTGTYQDQASNPVTPYIRFINFSEWAWGGDEDRIVANTLASRTRDILAALAHAQAKALKKSNFA